MIKKVPQDTNYFHFYNANPKGRRAADCVVRALANVLNQTWTQTYGDLFDLAMKYYLPPEEDKIVEKYLQSKGAIKHLQPRKGDNTKITGEELCFLIQEGVWGDIHSNYFINIGSHHCSCIINGRIEDIWNCSYEKVGRVWEIPEEVK